MPAAPSTRFIGVISKALKGGDSVTLVGFGTFEVRERAARTGRNPRTGEDDQDHGFEKSRVQGWQGPEGCRKLIGPAVDASASA